MNRRWTAILSSLLLGGILAAQYLPQRQISSGGTDMPIISATALHLTASAPTSLHTYTVTGGDLLVVDLTVESPVTLELVSPTGQVITSSNASTLNATYQTFTAEPGDPLEAGTHQRFEVTGPDRGKWQLRVNGNGADVPGLLNAYATGSGALTIQAAPGVGQPELGSSQRLFVTLQQGSSPVTGATVTATVEGPAATTTVTLTDDGTGVDRQANDGTYTALAPTDVQGSHRVTVQASGEAGGVPFQTQAYTSYHVYRAVARLPPGFTEEAPTDVNGDGVPDQLGVTLELNVLEAGTYRVAAVMQSGNGKQLYLTTRNVSYAPGLHRVTLPVTRTDLVQGLGVNGPYELTGAAVVSPAEGGRTVARAANLGSTSAIDLTAFKAPDPWGGYVGDRGIDENGDGTLDVIEVSFRVTVPAARVYTWSGELRVSPPNQLTRTVSSVASSAYVEAGERTLTLRFPVSDLVAANVNGPYLFDNVLVYSDAGGTVQSPTQFDRNYSGPMLTQAYQVTRAAQTVPELYDALKAQVGGVTLGTPGNGLRTSLQQKLENARRQVTGGQVKPALNLLGAFINEVNAQRGKAIGVDDADALIRAVNALARVIVQ